MNLSQRSYKKELLDADDIPANDLKRNLAELNFINTYLGGHSISIAGLKALVGNNKEITICEVGCGGGDNIAALNAWCKKQHIKASFIGVDINPVCIEFATEKNQLSNVSWIIDDYRNVSLPTKPDIIFSSLFCHHFADQEIIEQLKWMRDSSTSGFFINDLHRHRLAYQSIKLLSMLFSRSYLVKHDAPLSVARAFTKNEWTRFFKLAQIDNYRISWRWAFRYLVIYNHG